MKALVISGPGEAVLVQRPDPVPGPGEELVRVAAASVCATDRKLLARGADEPRIPGHEFAGRLADGSTVGVHPDIGCGRCTACRSGWENRCPDRVSLGLTRDGGLAQLAAVPRSRLIPLEDVPLRLAPFLEPLACCLHAVRMVQARAGDPAVVVGAGPMGLLSMWALQAAGARVAVCQRSGPRQETALALGADAIVSPGADAKRLAAALGEAPRVAIVTPPGSEALAWALERTAVGGAVHAFAGTPGGAAVDANLVHYRHLTLLGSTGSTPQDYRRAVELAGKAVDLGRLPHARQPLQALPELLAARHDYKIVVAPNGEGLLEDANP